MSTQSRRSKPPGAAMVVTPLQPLKGIVRYRLLAEGLRSVRCLSAVLPRAEATLRS